MPKRANFNVRHLFNNSVLKQNMKVLPTLAVNTLDQSIHGGDLLLDKGLGQAYQSPDQFTHMTGKPIVGLGLSEVSEKLKSLKAAKFTKPKNIRFSL
jgi:hypothetical protein